MVSWMIDLDGLLKGARRVVGRFRGQTPMLILGLATPLLAIGAFVITTGGSDRHAVVAGGTDRSPTPLPQNSTIGYQVLQPDGTPTPTLNVGGAASPPAGARPVTTTGTQTEVGRRARRGWGDSLTVTPAMLRPTTSAAPTRPDVTASSTPTPSTAPPGRSTTTTSSPAATTTTTAPPPNVLFSDPMAYSGALGIGGSFGSWSVATATGNDAVGTGSDLELAAAAAERTVVVGPGFGDLDLSVRVESVAQGGGSSTAWVLWHYLDAAHYLGVYVGGDGWAVLLVDPAQAGGLRLLAQGSDTTLAPGSATTVRVRQVGSSISVWSSGALLANVSDGDAPVSGAIGLASVGSTSRFGDVVVHSV